jgi:ComF family protein
MLQTTFNAYFYSFDIANENAMLINSIKNHFWVPLLESVYPRVCAACNYPLLSQESVICNACFYRFPKTNFHNEPDNALEKIFWGRIPLLHAAAYLYFRKKGKVQHLLHQLKYKGLKEVGFEVGKRYGKILKDSTHFQHLDLIIPVPIHPAKLIKRGYNQSEWFGLGLQESMQIPVSTTHLVKTENTQTQTKKNRYQRWENVETVFAIQNQESLQNKNVLLIDDVITTGSTIESCGSLLVSSGIKSLSLACIAAPIR